MKKAIKHHLKASFSTLIWIYRFLHQYKGKPKLKKVPSGKTLLILANGPSLNDVIHQIIPSEKRDIRVVNFFCFSSEFNRLKPSSYIIADPKFFFNDLEPNYLKFYDILNTISWDMTLIIPQNYYKNVRTRIKNQRITIETYYENSYDGYPRLRRILYQTNLSMPKCQNVVVPAIFVGINEGYEKIELYGVDHSWTKDIRVDNENRVCTISNHFYESSEYKLIPWPKTFGGIYKMHEILRDLALMFESYHQLREYADSTGCQILNKTPDSFVDAFERE